MNVEGFSEEEFRLLLNRIPTNRGTVSRPKAYSILINGELFVTDRGKAIWKQKNHAAAAFNNAMATKVQDVVRGRLQARGINRYEVYKFPEYMDAFANFKKALIEKGLYQIIELQ